MNHDRRWHWVLCVAAFALGMWWGPLNVVGLDLAYLPGDLGDNRFNNYVLERGHRWLSGQERSFWQATFCYPARWVIACSDAHIGNVPIYSGFRFCGCGPERAFQLWWLATYPLTFLATVWAARKCQLGVIGATVAALVFTFAPPIVVSTGHAQMFPRYFAPPALAFTWLYLREPTWQRLLGALGCWVAQVYCTVYIGYFLSLFMIVLAISTMIVSPRSTPWRSLFLPKRREFLLRMLVVALAVVALIPLLRPYVAPDRNRVQTPPEVVMVMLPKPLDWLRPSATSATWSWLRTAVGDVELAPGGLVPFHLFPGGMAVAGWLFGLGCVLISRRSPRVRLAATLAVAALLLGVFALRVEDHSAYRAMLHVPFASGIRAMFRIGILLLLPLGLLAGLAVDMLISKWNWRSLPAIVLLLFASIDLRSKPGEEGTPLRAAIERRERYANLLRDYPHAKVVYVFPGKRDTHHAILLHVDVMWAAMEVSVPTINGWTGQWPEGWFSFAHYGDLLHWYCTRNGRTTDGLVTFGEPVGYDDTPAERAFRTQFPTQPWPE